MPKVRTLLPACCILDTGAGGETMGSFIISTDWDSPTFSYFPGPVVSPRTRTPAARVEIEST
jgi:hypothetical protein